MEFDLPEELSELQATVRRLAQDKVKPRAREIDETHRRVEAGLSTGRLVLKPT